MSFVNKLHENMKKNHLVEQGQISFEICERKSCRT